MTAKWTVVNKRGEFLREMGEPLEFATQLERARTFQSRDHAEYAAFEANQCSPLVCRSALRLFTSEQAKYNRELYADKKAEELPPQGVDPPEITKADFVDEEKAPEQPPGRKIESVFIDYDTLAGMTLTNQVITKAYLRCKRERSELGITFQGSQKDLADLVEASTPAYGKPPCANITYKE